MYFKKRFVTILMIITVIISISACQSTPEKQTVVNKANNALEDLVLEKAEEDSIWAQSDDNIIWNETKTVNTELGECTVTVSMNAKIPRLPGNVPVYIIEPKRFDVKFFAETANALIAGEIYEGTPSKQDILMEILDFKKQISAHTIIDQDNMEQTLEFLNTRYEEAPENNSEFVFDYNDTSGRIIHIKSYHDNNSIMDFCAYGSCFDFRTNETNRTFHNSPSQSSAGIQAVGTETTYEQAKEIADELMKSLFEAPFAIAYSNIASKTNDLEDLWKDGQATSLGEAYVFYYTREYDSIPSLYIDPASKIVDDGTEFRKPNPREGTRIVVDDRGVIEMQYQSFSDTIEKLNDNVLLMPFNDVLEYFKDGVFSHRLWGVKKAQIDISRIEFGMVREPIKDKPDQYMMVPAWNFIGNINSGMFEEQEKSILALSAINGSVITDYELVF